MTVIAVQCFLPFSVVVSVIKILLRHKPSTCLKKTFFISAREERRKMVHILRMYYCLFLVVALLSSCSGISAVRGPSETVWAFAGGDAILPCTFNINDGDDFPTVEWSKEGLQPNIVFLYRDGCETYEMKNPAFEYRTSFITKELQNRIISLRISSVQLSDAGKYQCKRLWKNAPRDITTVQLVVGAVSEPKLSVVSAKSGGVNLQCEANCWLPEPEITFLNDRGKEIPADDPKRHRETSGCYTVTRKVMLRDATNSVTCRVHQPKTNQTRNAEILIPVDCMTSCFLPTAITVGVTILLLLPTCALAVFVWMKCRKAVADLKSQLGEKEENTRQPLNSRPQLSPTVCHHDQPVCIHAASTHYTTHRNQSCTACLNDKEPSSSSLANAAKKTSHYAGRSKSMSHSLRPVDHKLQHRRSLVLPSSVVQLPRSPRNSNEESEYLVS